MSEPTQTSRKKSRRRNGDGNTYRHKNGWRTVIEYKGQTVTAMGRSEQESRRLAKAKLAALLANFLYRTSQFNSRNAGSNQDYRARELL